MERQFSGVVFLSGSHRVTQRNADQPCKSPHEILINTPLKRVIVTTIVKQIYLTP